MEKNAPGSDAGTCKFCDTPLTWDRTGGQAHDRAGEYICVVARTGHTHQPVKADEPDPLDPESYARIEDPIFWRNVGMPEITQRNWGTLHERMVALQTMGRLFTKGFSALELAAMAYAQIGSLHPEIAKKTDSQFRKDEWDAMLADANSANWRWVKKRDEQGRHRNPAAGQ